MSESENSVTIGEQKYDVSIIPPETAPVVQASVDDTLQTLSLKSVIKDLDRVNQLLYLAYTGVSGHGDLSAKVSGMQYGLLKLCSTAIATMNSIKSSSEVIVGNVHNCIRFLYGGKETLAVKFLGRCGEYAQRMSDESSKLSKGFNELADTAQESLEDTLVAQGADAKERDQVKATIATIEANSAEAEIVSKELETAITETKKRYNEAKEDKEKAGDRAFAMAIVGAVTGAIGQGVGAAAAIYAGSKTPPNMNVNPQGGAAQPPAAPPSKNEEKEVSDTVNTSSDKDKVKTATEIAEGEGADKTEEAEAAKDDLGKSKIAAAHALSEASKSIGTDSKEMSGSYSDIAEGYRLEQMKFLDMQIAQEAQQRELLGSIAKYARLLSERKEEHETLSKTVLALQQAIGALKQIATALETAGLFWSLMAQRCREIGEASWVKDVEMFMDALPLEDRMKEYHRDEFKEQIIRYYASWQALKVIAIRYQSAANLAHSEVKLNIEKNPSLEDAKDLAVELGKKLLGDAEKDMLELDASTAKNKAAKIALSS